MPPSTMPPADEEDMGEVEEIGLEVTDEDHAKADHESTTVGLGGVSIEVNSRMMPYIGQILAAVVLLIAVTVPSGDVKNGSYGIAGAVIAMFFAIVGCYLVKVEEMYDRPIGTFPLVGTLTVGNVNARFLFMWWFIAAGVLTFNGPFEVTSNGYFACWGGVILAAMALGVTTEAMKSQAGGLGFFNGLLVASIVLLCAVPQYIGGTHNGESVYCLVIAILSAAAVLAFGAYPSVENYKFPFFALFAILWIVLACLTTFRGPFLQTGNGYFASWFGCILCIMAAAASRTSGGSDTSESETE